MISAAKQPEILHVPLVANNDLLSESPNYWAAGQPSHKMGFRSSVSKSGHPGEGKHEGLVRRNDVLTNGFIGFSLA